MCRSGNAPDTTRADKTEPPPDMSFRANAVSRGIYSSCKFTLCWFLYPRGGFLHSADATVGMTKMGTFSGIIRNSSVLSGAERHTGRSLRFRCLVDSFNRTGYIRNVAGGRLPPLRSRWGVVPFNHTGSSRYVSGTAHRPFPTVSLIG